MGKNGKTEGLDATLFCIVGASFSLPFLIEAYGLDIRLMAIPSIFYGFWILIVAYFLPKVVYDDQPQLANVKRIRGWAYVLGLPVCIVLNLIFNTAFPKDFTTLSIAMVIVPMALSVVIIIVPRSIYRKETNRMDNKQYRTMAEMLKWTGSSMIMASMSLVILTMMATWVPSQTTTIIGYVVVSIALLAASYYYHRKSSITAVQLADSLKINKPPKRKTHYKYT